jgi:hypothetical protein
VIATPAAESHSQRKTLLNIALAVIGGVLLIVTVRRVGWTDVQHSVASLGWWFVPILALGGIRFAARARAWVECARTFATDRSSLPVWPLLRATIAADALGNLTPLGLLASEPAKVYFVNQHVPILTAVSSVAAENAFYIASVLTMIGAGALTFFELADLSNTLQLAAQALLAAVMLGALSGLWIARRQPAILSRLAQLVARLTGRGAVAPERLRELEVHFYAVLRWPASRMARVLMWEALFHAAAVAEVYLVLRLLPAGRPITLVDAFVLETAGRLIIVAFKFVPYRLGVDEAGSALVARALAIDPAVGVTLALVRRIRILCWNAAGLGLLFARREPARGADL